MKKLYILTLLMSLLGVHQSQAQCTNSVIDWDYREFFAQDNSTITTYVSSAQSQTQYFALGANKVTITHNYTGNNVGGDNTNNTGELGSYGTGADIEFTGNGVVTVTFQNPVTNVKFSMYDIDRSQSVAITALNVAASANITTIAKLSGANLVVAGSGTATATATALPFSIGNSSTDGTINVDIAGPITSFTMTVTSTGTCSSGCGATGGSETGEFYISDITACSPGSFPNNYQAVSQPFTGQPAYVLVVVDSSFYYLNPLTGIAKFIFRDNTHSNMNSMAYDPNKRLIYYTYSLSGPGNSVNANEKALRRYDCAMDTFGIVLSNVNNLGIPTFGQGVESGAAAFYNGKLYWGIEGHSNVNVESIIWEVDLNASNFPVSYRQVYAQQAYTSSGGGQRLHDWADFDINNGILYDFDGGVNLSPGTNTDFYQQNLLTGIVTRYTPAAGVIPRQVSVDWQGNIYNIGSPNSTTAGSIALYNGTTNQGTPVTITYKGVGLMGSWGDGAEAFRPLSDFGDAPASYDPNPLSPAVNERDTALRLGTGLNIEWLSRGQTTLANSDNFDDAISGAPRIFSNLYSTYYQQISVHNNTGANAFVRAWLDWNGNGVFDAGEASAAVTVPTNAANQNVSLNWTGISSTLTTGSFTFLRIRISSTAMTTGNATGWFDNGETEDYRIVVNNIVLPVNLVSFDAKAINNSSVRIDWTASEDVVFSGYELQRSHNGTEWEKIAFIPASDKGGLQHYESIDTNPYKGSSKYRVKIVETGATKYSEIRTVKITDLAALFTLTPNPASTKATVTITGDLAGEIAQIRVMDSRGNELSYQKVRLSVGTNPIDLSLKTSWPAGTYIVLVTTDAGTVNNKLIIRR